MDAAWQWCAQPEVGGGYVTTYPNSRAPWLALTQNSRAPWLALTQACDSYCVVVILATL
jgi:hypothetical protein